MKTVLRHFLLIIFVLFGQLVLAQDAGLDIATQEIDRLAKEKNYSPSDISAPIITDDYTSNGIRHIYFQQTVDQVGIYGTSGAVHLKGKKIIASSLDYLPQVEKRIVKKELNVPQVNAIEFLALDQGYPIFPNGINVIASDDGSPDQTTTVNAVGISSREVPMKLTYFEGENGEMQLAWEVYIEEVIGAAYKNFLVDAADGTVLLEKDLTVNCSFEDPHEHNEDHNHNHPIPENKSTTQTAFSGDSTYNVLKHDIESLNFGSRTLEMNPWTDTTASPNGWHQIDGIDSEYTYGNNVDAYCDTLNLNPSSGTTGTRAFGGTNLVFDFPLDVSSTSKDSIDAAVTNLFYITNIAHDVFYNYGFDEVSGNFQKENFDTLGIGNDHLLAESNDSGFSQCNATMNTPVDGSSPRLQMRLCGNNDGSFDNGVVLHEYAHGISNRLTGGPQRVGCLSNGEQMGEGWSDFFGLWFSIKPTDTGLTQRTFGTYANGEGPGDSGYRVNPYTTDMAVNPTTYEDIKNSSAVWWIGEIWAMMLWEMTWGLIDEHGFESDIYNNTSTAGNIVALNLVMEGLKLQPCSPGFVDGRDAILAADSALYNGAHTCIIWEAFAKRGLGYYANQRSTDSNDVLPEDESFEMPPSCSIDLIHTVDKPVAYLGERLTFQLTAVNNLDNQVATNIILTDTLPEHTTFYSASDGGILIGNRVEWPAFDLPIGGTTTVELKVVVDDVIPFDPDFLDDMESGGGNWKVLKVEASLDWVLQNGGSPVSQEWFVENADSTTETHLVLKEPLGLTDTSELSFKHNFDLENGWDYGLVDISIDGGSTWINLESDFIQNGYNVFTDFEVYAFSGNSNTITGHVNGYITSIANLAPYAGKAALIRFRILSDGSTKKDGWSIDDIAISNTNLVLPNYGNIQNANHNFNTQIQTPPIINRDFINHTVTTASDTLYSSENAGIRYADIQANDIDPDGSGDTLITTILEAPSNGVAAVVIDDSISYIPNASFVGNDTLVYQVCDELNACESDTLFVIVVKGNDPPITALDFLAVDKNTTDNYINVQLNDSDPNAPADTLITSILEGPNNGIASVVADEGINYTPTTAYVGLDTIEYQVCDTANVCTADTLFITINDYNEGPTAMPDYLMVEENSTNNYINVQANDSDPNGVGDSLLTSILVTAQNGTASVVDDDSINYTPTLDYFGLDTIVYEVCDTANLCASDTVFIIINEALVCEDDTLEMNENGIPNGNYVAADQIISEGVVKEDSVVTFVAGSQIVLSAGFHAEAGSGFTAYIDDCAMGGGALASNDPSTQKVNPTVPELLKIKKLTALSDLALRPNPFSHSAIIDYELGKDGPIWIGLHDMTGKILQVFINNQQQSAGKYQYHLSVANLSAGAYWVSMRTGNEVLTKKVVVLQE